MLPVFTCLEPCLSTSSGALGVSCRLFSWCHFSPVFCPLTSTQNYCDRFCGQKRVWYAALTKKLSHVCGVCQMSLHDHGLPFLLRGFGPELDLFSCSSHDLLILQPADTLVHLYLGPPLASCSDIHCCTPYSGPWIPSAR